MYRHFGDGKYLLSLPVSEPRIVQPVAWSLWEEMLILHQITTYQAIAILITRSVRASNLTPLCNRVPNTFWSNCRHTWDFARYFLIRVWTYEKILQSQLQFPWAIMLAALKYVAYYTHFILSCICTYVVLLHYEQWQYCDTFNMGRSINRTHPNKTSMILL